MRFAYLTLDDAYANLMPSSYQKSAMFMQKKIERRPIFRLAHTETVAERLVSPPSRLSARIGYSRSSSSSMTSAQPFTGGRDVTGTPRFVAMS